MGVKGWPMIRMVVCECFFWYRPIRVVLEQRPLNGCCCTTAIMKHTCWQCRVLAVALPAESRCSVCRIRWWQPLHSGAGRDVWALDDVTVADSVHHMLWIDFSDYDPAEHSVNIHHGQTAAHCESPKALV